jgi:hypothetical protein
MSVINNPLEWSYPSNYKKISCYADSALWALLFKKDNDFYRLVNDFSDKNIKTKYALDSRPKADGIRGLPQNCKIEKYTLLRQNILDFYNGITNQPKQNLQPYVVNILEMFNTCFPTNKWNREQCDANDFFYILINIFSLKDVNENIIQKETQKYTYESEEPRFSDTNENNLSIINIVTNPNDIDFRQIQKIDDNNLIVPYNVETLNETENNIADKITKTRQIILQYESRNEINSAIFNFKRMGFYFDRAKGESIQIKIFDPVNFSLKIGDLMLNSIIVHQGSFVLEGHYVCYFKHENNWFLMNDLDGISPVEGEIYNVPGILTNCTTLVYSKASQNELDSTEDGYAYDLFIRGGGVLVEKLNSELNQPKLKQPKLNPLVTKPKTLLPKKTVAPTIAQPIITPKKDWLKMFNDCKATEPKGGTRKKCKKKKYNKCRRTRKGRKTRKIIRGKKKKYN